MQKLRGARFVARGFISSIPIIYYTLFFCWINYGLKRWLIADYIHIPPQTPALNKGGASGKAMPCSPLARWGDIGIMGSEFRKIREVIVVSG